MLDESLRSEIARLKNNRANSEFGSAGDERPPETESHFNRLSNLLKKLRSITDRAPDINARYSSLSHDFELLVIAALREAECADLIEKSMETDLTTLCSELKRKDEALQTREMALARLEETTKASRVELETRIQNQENQLKNLETEQQQLTTERDYLVNSLNEAELTAKQAEAEAHQLKERMEEEVSALKLQIAKREEFLDARKADLNRAEGDQKNDIETLQLRLRDTEAKLANQERELKEKESTIHSAGVRETELGKLIERLSSECEKLSAELCEKKLMISRFEDETRCSFINGGKAWGKVVRLVRVGRIPSDDSNRT
jgi:chromosome segregation ATPase